MFGWIERLWGRRTFTVIATGTQSNEMDFRGCYPTRIFVESTTGAPTSLGFSLDNPGDSTAAFVQLYTGGSAMAITVTVNKWNAISDDIAKLIGCSRIKVDCAAWTDGGRIWVDTST